MKKIHELAMKRGYTISFCDRSGNWKGGHYRGDYIIIHFPGGTKECTTVKAAINFLR